VGRRDGARAADFQQLLTERAGLARAHVRRIRVRERNAFVSVRRDDLPHALAALSGASIAGKVAMAEQARGLGSGATGEAAADDAVPTPKGTAAMHTEASAPPQNDVGDAPRVPDPAPYFDPAAPDVASHSGPATPGLASHSGPAAPGLAADEPAEEAVPTGRSMS
jgi:ATP-dependent RNA helicase DeaD